MTPYISNGEVILGYRFDQNYTDFCNADNPNCVSGVTCPDCNDGFNPHLIVASYIISNGDVPMDGTGIVNTEEERAGLSFHLYPNPTTGWLNIQLDGPSSQLDTRVFNSLGQVVHSFREDGNPGIARLSLDGLHKGFYSVEVKTERGTGVRKVVVE
jgi:hypothetical protein